MGELQVGACMGKAHERTDRQDYHTLPCSAVHSKVLMNKLHRDGRLHRLHEAIHAGNTLVLVTLLDGAYRLPRGALLFILRSCRQRF